MRGCSRGHVSAKTAVMKQSAVCLALSLAFFGCNQESGPKARSAPAADHAAYAVEYPQRLTTATARQEFEAKGGQTLVEQIPKYPEELGDPDWNIALGTYQRADEDGKSGHFAEVQRDSALVAKFFVDEKQQLVRQVGGSVDHEAKQNACKGDYYGAVSWGLEKAVQDRLKERADEASSALKYLEQNGDALKKKADRTALEKQARDLALAAYLAHVALPERHEELQSLVAEHDAVKKTLARRREEIEKTPADSGDAAAKKSRQAELDAIVASEQALASAHDAAKKRLEESEQQVEKAQKAYDEAYDALDFDVRVRLKVQDKTKAKEAEAKKAS
jgi:hypothetical protein